MEKRSAPRKTVRRKAATKDVVGTSLANKVPPKWRKYYERLIEMRTFLRRQKKSQLRNAKQQNLRFSQHMADAGTNSYEKDLALSRVSSQQDALFEIGAALDRIEEGTFGICEMTGKPIERDRLDAIPWTRFSASAERGLEQKGEVKRAGIPAPQKVGRTGTSNRVGTTWSDEEVQSVERNRKPKQRNR